MSRSHRLVVVDDHDQFRRGLIELLEEMPDFLVVGEAADGRAGLELMSSQSPDLVLLDVHMPGMGGLDALEQARADHPNLPVLMLTVSRDTDALLRAINAGAAGYVLKNVEPDELRNVILRMLRGESVLAPEVTGTVLDTLRRLHRERARGLLSRRELDVLECLRRELTTPQIAAELFISENTVKTHVSHILEKLGARKRSEAVANLNQLLDP